MVSPGRISKTSPPRAWTSPIPSVTCRVCPRAWQCHALRAPGANRTTLTRIRDGSSPRAMTSNQASPVNVSAGALTLGCFGLISNFLLLLVVTFPFQGACPWTGGGVSVIPGTDRAHQRGAGGTYGGKHGQPERDPRLPRLQEGQDHPGAGGPARRDRRSLTGPWRASKASSPNSWQPGRSPGAQSPPSGMGTSSWLAAGVGAM